MNKILPPHLARPKKKTKNKAVQSSEGFACEVVSRSPPHIIGFFLALIIVSSENLLIFVHTYTNCVFIRKYRLQGTSRQMSHLHMK